MKKVFLVMLSIIMICSSCFVLTGCSSVSKDDVVGVWENVARDRGVVEKYMYVYEDGTCDSYGTHSGAENETDPIKYNELHTHYPKYEWSIEGDYFVRHSAFSPTKYKIDGTKMYDSQGKLIYKKTSYSVKDDVVITK